jgi:hypothetical protein
MDCKNTMRQYPLFKPFERKNEMESLSTPLDWSTEPCDRLGVELIDLLAEEFINASYINGIETRNEEDGASRIQYREHG